MTESALPTVYRTEIPGVSLVARGKVRDIYDLGDTLLLVSTDRLSAFDHVFPNAIPDSRSEAPHSRRVEDRARQSRCGDPAHPCLRRHAVRQTGTHGHFGLSEIQAQAILDMRLQRLTGLERDKILEEHKETTELIRRLREILADVREVLKIIAQELAELRTTYGDDRRTQIVDAATDINIEDMIVEEDMVVTVSHEGYVKRSPAALYRTQKRGGRGRTSAKTRGEDFVEHVFLASTHSYLLFFTNRGRVY